jgi:hypothetical protein
MEIIRNGAADALRVMVGRRHSCQAALREVVGIVEQLDGERVWQGKVYVFDLIGHPHASVAFAWEESVAGDPRPVMHTVLGIPPINSPMDAVRHAGKGLDSERK